MSSGDGIDEGPNDAADIAAFFKSGKSKRGELLLPMPSVSDLPLHC